MMELSYRVKLETFANGRLFPVLNNGGRGGELWVPLILISQPQHSEIDMVACAVIVHSTAPPANRTHFLCSSR